MVIKFDLSSITSIDHISNATLSLYCYSDSFYKNKEKQIYVLLTPWSENSVTWSSPWQNKGGDTASTFIYENTNKEEKIWEHFDVTAAVQGMIEQNKPNNGFIIGMRAGPDTFHQTAQYYSSESTVNESLRPKLTITDGAVANIAIPKFSIIRTKIEHSNLGFTINRCYKKNLTLTIFNISGRAVQSFNSIVAGKFYSYENKLSSGLYIAKLSSGKKLINREMIVIGK